MARDQWAPPAAHSNTIRRHANPPQPPLPRRALTLLLGERLRALTNADRGALFVMDPEGKSLTSVFADGTEVTMPVGSGIAGHVAQTGAGACLRDAAADPRFNPAVDARTGYRTQSLLCVPLRAEGRVVAVAQLLNKRGPDGAGALPFTAHDRAGVSALGAYAGLALVTAARLRASDAEQRRADATGGLARELVGAADDEEALAAVIADRAAALCGAPGCVLCVLEPEMEQLHVRPRAGGPGFCVPLAGSLAADAAASGGLIRVPDAHLDQRWNAALDGALGCRVRGVLCVPLGEGAGAAAPAVLLLANHPDADLFAPADEEALVAFAALAGTAVRRARACRSMRQVQAAMDLVPQLAAAAGDEADLARLVTSRARALTAGDRAALYIVNPDDPQQLDAHVGDAPVLRLPLTGDLVGHVVRTGRPLNVPDAHRDERFRKTADRQSGYRTESVLGLPLVCGGAVVAVLQVVNKTAPSGGRVPFTAADLERLAPVAAIAGAFLQTGRLGARLAVRCREAELVSKNMLSISSIDLEGVGEGTRSRWPPSRLPGGRHFL